MSYGPWFTISILPGTGKYLGIIEGNWSIVVIKTILFKELTESYPCETTPCLSYFRKDERDVYTFF